MGPQLTLLDFFFLILSRVTWVTSASLEHLDPR